MCNTIVFDGHTFLHFPSNEMIKKKISHHLMAQYFLKLNFGTMLNNSVAFLCDYYSKITIWITFTLRQKKHSGSYNFPSISTNQTFYPMWANTPKFKIPCKSLPVICFKICKPRGTWVLPVTSLSMKSDWRILHCKDCTCLAPSTENSSLSFSQRHDLCS
jgi:hypothetical protein